MSYISRSSIIFLILFTIGAFFSFRAGIILCTSFPTVAQYEEREPSLEGKGSPISQNERLSNRAAIVVKRFTKGSLWLLATVLIAFAIGIGIKGRHVGYSLLRSALCLLFAWLPLAMFFLSDEMIQALSPVDRMTLAKAIVLTKVCSALSTILWGGILFEFVKPVWNNDKRGSIKSPASRLTFEPSSH